MTRNGPKPAPDTTLVRDLGLGPASAVVVGTIIGSGIFLVPAEMMQAVGSAKLVYLAWIIGGALSFFGALTYAELAAMKPQAGGEYVYIRDAYGPLPGFLSAWTWFILAKPASIATVTVGLVRVLETFPALSSFSGRVVSTVIPVTNGQLIAIAATLFISFLNYIGVKRAGEFQLLFTLLKIAIILVIVWVGFSYVSGSWSNFATSYPGARGGIVGFMAALVAALWAYDGWNLVTMVSEEIRQPDRNLPIALIVGVAVVAVLYMLVNAAVQYVLPASAIATSLRPASDAIGLVRGPSGAMIVSLAMAISMLATLNGSILTGARMPFAMARDRLFFSALANVHPRFHTPYVAIIVQAAIAVALLLAGGSFRQFFSLTIFSEWLSYMVAATTIFVFRRRQPQAVRPYRVWGYPVVPAIFVVAAAFLLYYSFTDNFPRSLFGLLAIAAGVPIYYAFAHRRRPGS
ncbi:MAG TPA: amino acid permease [Terriglobales bacterium]